MSKKEKLLMQVFVLAASTLTAASASAGGAGDAFCVGVEKIAKVWTLAKILLPVLFGLVPIGGGIAAVKSAKIGLGVTMIIIGAFVGTLTFVLMQAVDSNQILAVCQ